MAASLSAQRESALRGLAGAYARNWLSTATLERRIEIALRASHPRELDGCLWDVERQSSWRTWFRGRRARPPAWLLVDDGEPARRISLPPAPGSIVIGRGRSCDVSFANTSVSRRHAAISRRGHLTRVRDLASTNGTWVNGEIIEVSDLVAGDYILIGEVVISVR